LRGVDLLLAELDGVEGAPLLLPPGCLNQPVRLFCFMSPCDAFFCKADIADDAEVGDNREAAT
jgi:hypothetical protein